MPTHRAVLSALGSLTLSAAAALAQPCNTPFDCDPPLPGGFSMPDPPPSPRAPFVPDRRPVYWFNLFCGSTCRTCGPDANPKGHSPYWARADWPVLERNLNALFDDGFRRIVLQRPGGGLPGEWKVNQSQYHHLTNEQKALIQGPLADWIACRRAGCDGRPAAPDLQLGVFIGSWQYKVCTPCLTPDGGTDDMGTDDPKDDIVWWDCPPEAEMHFMDPFDPQSEADMYANILPWADAGFDAIWFDNASRRDPNLDQSPDALLAMRELDALSSVVLGGEAVPWYKIGRERFIDTYYTERAPWFGLYWWFRRTGWLGPKGSNPHDADPDTTEIGVVFGETPDRLDELEDSKFVHSLAQVADVRDRGFVIWASHSSIIPFTQRLYDGDDGALFAALMVEGNPADFNADGRIDCLDHRTFFKNWSDSLLDPKPAPAFWDGDIDNDDKVTPLDVLAFLNLAAWDGCTP